MSNKTLALNYSDLWFKFGFLTEEDLHEQIKIFETSDRDAEHFRYQSFQRFLFSRKEFTDDEIDKYLQLAKIDEDEIMAGAAIVNLLSHRELSDYQFEKACDALSQFGDWTKKIILREILYRKFNKAIRNEEIFKEEVFLEFLNIGNGDVHRVLIEYANKVQMELIAEKGATRAVRNIAKQELRSRKFR
jgi:hypothetical protein